MLVIKKICDYTIPMFGNKRVLPYAKLLVSDGITEKLTKIASASWTPAQQKLVNQSVGHDGSLWLPSWPMLPQPEAA